jgi:hypothetical protein
LRKRHEAAGEHTGANSIAVVAHPDDQRGLRLLRRLGFEPIGNGTGDEPQAIGLRLDAAVFRRAGRRAPSAIVFAPACRGPDHAG